MSLARSLRAHLPLALLACISLGVAAGSAACASPTDEDESASADTDAVDSTLSPAGKGGRKRTAPTATTTTTAPAPTTTTTTAPAPTTTGTVTLPLPLNTYGSGVRFRGINRAGAEYGDDWHGWTGQTYYVWPTAAQLSSELAYLDSLGMNVVRLPISWERLQHTLGGPLNTTYESEMKRVVGAITAAGFYCILDLHNYNRYATGTHTGDQVQTQTANYVQRVLGDGTLTNAHVIDVWTKLAGAFKADGRVQFNLMNEAHDFPMTSDAYVTSVNALVASIRAAGAQNMVIVPNSRSSDITHFGVYSPNGGTDDMTALLKLVDPANNMALDMHQYLHGTVTSSTQYVEQNFARVTSWARANGLKLYLTEMGADPSAPYAQANVTNLLAFLDGNADVWIGWTPWNLSPYKLTGTTYTVDGPMMPWYKPYLTPDTVKLL